MYLFCNSLLAFHQNVNHLIYQHEISPDADGAAMGETFTTGWFALAEGDVMAVVAQVWPDFKGGSFGLALYARVNLTISGADYPGLVCAICGSLYSHSEHYLDLTTDETSVAKLYGGWNWNWNLVALGRHKI